MGSKNALFDN